MIFGGLLVLLLSPAAWAAHTDMFSCRSGKNCPITELTDDNWDTKLLEPHFVMFYAPWCGHCRQLAPKLKKAAKVLQDAGVRVGAVDVEPNPKVQGKFPDIRGFPTLKFVGSPDAKRAVDYNGQREDDAIVEFAKQQAKKMGVTLGETVPTKTHAELYTYFGRAALDRVAALLVVGGSGAAPAWLGKAATELRKEAPNQAGPKPEARTRELIEEAKRVTKVGSVKEGLDSVLGALDAHERGGGPLGPPVVAPAFTSDPAAVEAFGAGSDKTPTLVLAAVDRKSGAGTFVKYDGPPLGDKTKPTAVAAWVRGLLPHAATPGALADHAGDAAAALPAFPKPANVLAAEVRAQKAKAAAGAITGATDADSLQEHCYGLEGKTCALLAVRGGAAAAAADGALSALAKKYHRDGFAFVALDPADAPAGVVESLFGEMAEGGPALAVIKTGKRPRVARVAGPGSFDGLLDSVVGGGAKFDKLGGGLPQWTAAA